jgi:type III restriction enzyme
MKGFNFEKNLSHQSHAVNSTDMEFENIRLVPPTEVEKNYINPAFDFLSDRAYPQNSRKVMDANGYRKL